jgi:hypothetical protein
MEKVMKKLFIYSKNPFRKETTITSHQPSSLLPPVNSMHTEPQNYLLKDATRDELSFRKEQ